jgi:4-amino-4-deoxy-L-arabinose transferase-like glycosyltransferase
MTARGIDLARRIPRVVVAVFVVALLNGVAWSVLVPPFQVPDETSHFAYVQQLAETGHRAGRPGRPEFSSEQSLAMAAMRTGGIIGRAWVHPPETKTASAAANSAIADAARNANRADGGGPSTSSPQPPLYYALQVIPYKLFSWASLPARLEAMRLLSALMFAVSAALCALLAMELVGGRPWIAGVAGFSIALSPYTAFIASGVTPDVQLMLVSTALLLVVVRAFRRGLTRRRAVALGLLVGLGMLTKLTFVALLPAAALAAVILLWRDRRALAAPNGNRSIAATVGLAVAAALAPLLVVFVYAQVSGGGLTPVAGGGTAQLPLDQIRPFQFREFLSYMWQLYLPRLPFQIDQFGFSAPYETWIKGFAGRFGWLDYGVPLWMSQLARDIVFLGLALILASAVRYWRALLRQWSLLLVLAVFTAGLAYAIARKGYDYHRETNLIFEQARYLFPIAGLYASAVAFALLAFGRRIAPTLAIAAVVLFAVHNVAGVMVTLARYYG